MDKPKTTMYKRFTQSENGYTKITECEVVISQGENKVVLRESEFKELKQLLQASFKAT